MCVFMCVWWWCRLGERSNDNKQNRVFDDDDKQPGAHDGVHTTEHVFVHLCMGVCSCGGVYMCWCCLVCFVVCVHAHGGGDCACVCMRDCVLYTIVCVCFSRRVGAGADDDVVDGKTGVCVCVCV